MATYIGEYECKLDAKGRMLFPAGLLRQIPLAMRKDFIVNRSVFDKCLVLYPMDAWEEITGELVKLNRFNKKNDFFVRQYTNGAETVELDGSNRLLFPKKLLDYGSIDKDVVLVASLNKIEIWSKATYDDMLNSYDPDKFAELAEEVMGKKGDKGDGVS